MNDVIQAPLCGRLGLNVRRRVTARGRIWALITRTTCENLIREWHLADGLAIPDFHPSTMLTDAIKAELKATADALSSPGKGFLASDESAGPWLRAGHSEAKKIPDTAENRAACEWPCISHTRRL